MNTVLCILAGIFCLNIFVTPIIEHKTSYHPKKND
jgi:hypothetical protein